jgi:adenosine deaminase
MPSTDPTHALPIDVVRAIDAIPKADLHLHQEAERCLDRIYARRDGRPPYDWSAWRRRIIDTIPAGPERLRLIGSVKPVPLGDEDDDLFVARFAELLEFEAAAGAHYVEVRGDGRTLRKPRFMELFRQAEQRAQQKYPPLRAEAIAIVMTTLPPDDIAAVADTCVRARAEGLAGVDFLYQPYLSDADWTPIYRLADRFAQAGLGVTAHAGELTAANIAAAARTPGLTRIGHGIHAASDPSLIELLIDRDITLECALSCNAFLGATPSLAEHPLPRLIAAGVAVALATDNPIQVGTTIGREYLVAAWLGVTTEQLRRIARDAIAASFTTPDRRAELFAHLDRSLRSA